MEQQRSNIVKACVAGIVTLVVGLLLLGIPGAIVLEALATIGTIRTVTGDAAWPAAIVVTMAGAVMVTLASLAMRTAMPGLSGWRHMLAAAALALIATALLTAVALR